MRNGKSNIPFPLVKFRRERNGKEKKKSSKINRTI